MIINMKTGNIDWMMNIDWIYYWVINDEYYLELLFGWVVWSIGLEILSGIIIRYNEYYVYLLNNTWSGVYYPVGLSG